jgi:cysteine desulfuration protein SufE
MISYFEIAKNFQSLTEWADRYEYLIEIAEDLPKFPEEEKKTENLVQGCSSRTWIISKNNLILAEADSLTVRGLLVLVLSYLNENPDISKLNLNFLNSLGLDKYLSLQRQNGLQAILKKIQNEYKK